MDPLTASATSNEWAEMIDVSLPVPEFTEKIKDMAVTYTFELDNFQKQAILKLEEGYHVLVAAHTSAGKTVVAEYAIGMSKRNGTRAIYTSPTKALSNQKCKDFEKQFGEVGLLTGDVMVNPTATLQIMTTEIFRSMLYEGKDMTDLEFVIFDEVHYINDAERGHVWEEVLILLPDHVTMVLLSATVPEPLQFATWLGHIKQRKVYIVSTPQRPVPLCHYLYTGRNYFSRNDRFLVVDQDGNFQQQGYDKAIAARKETSAYEDYDDTFIELIGVRRRTRGEWRTTWISLLEHLKEQDKLPAVVFMFSRARCESTAESLMTEAFTTDTEKSRIRRCFDKCVRAKLIPEDVELPQVLAVQRFVLNGIGVHHSGVLPMLRDVVELLFQCGFIKVIFATETLAMGMNMPTRTVVLDSLTKCDRGGQRSLTPAEYAQMAGRAGRRGLDATGTVIIMSTGTIPALEPLQKMVLGKPEQLTSQFRLSYTMILSLLRADTISVEEMMLRSFREFLRLTPSKCNNYSKQLQLAESDYKAKCRTPLAAHQANLLPFIKAGRKYIDLQNEIMPLLLNTAKVTKEIVPGKILVVSAGPYVNQLGVVLNNKTILGLGPKQAPYKVLLLDTKDTKFEEKFELDENFYRMLSFSALPIGTREKTLTHVVLNITLQNIIAVTKMNMKIDHKLFIDVWERRQLPRFKDSPVGPTCTSALQELSRISCEVYSGSTTLDYISLTDLVSNTTEKIQSDIRKINKCKKELENLKKFTEIANFKTEFAIVYERTLIKHRRDKCRQLSFGKLALYPEYQNRLSVLRELNYIDELENVLLKGQVACGFGTHELIITELTFRDVLTDMTSAEIAALLSGFVYQRTTGSWEWTGCTDKLREGIKITYEIDAELRDIEEKYNVDKCPGQEGPYFDLSRTFYEWTLEEPLALIMYRSEADEGTIVKCIKHLHEILGHLCVATKTVGNQQLHDIVSSARDVIYRGIINFHCLSAVERKDTVNQYAALVHIIRPDDISELVSRDVFTDNNPAEIAALLSCFVFQAQTKIGQLIASKSKSKYSVGQYKGQAGRLNFGVVRVVYEWVLEELFAEIMDLTDVEEGSNIVRCFQQLREVKEEHPLLEVV